MHDFWFAFLPVPFLASLAADHPVLAADGRRRIAVACGRSVPDTLGLKDGALAHLPPRAITASGKGTGRWLTHRCPRQLQPVVAAMPGTRIWKPGAEPAGPFLPPATAESRAVRLHRLSSKLASGPDHGVLQVRSASRLGDSDLGVNERRIEVLREALLP